MTTRAILRARILDDLLRTQATDGTRIDNAIDDAITQYQRHRFYFNERAVPITFPTVAAQQTYTFSTPTTVGNITTEFYRIDAVYLTDSNSDVTELDQADYTDILAWTDNPADSSEPTDWAYAHKRLLFFPIPDAIYTIGLVGHTKVLTPATDGETDNPWMTEAFELIRSAAKRYFALHVLRDQGLAGDMAGMEAVALNSLESATADRVRMGFITPSSDF